VRVWGFGGTIWHFNSHRTSNVYGRVVKHAVCGRVVEIL
jgi:hypothetical protein